MLNLIQPVPIATIYFGAKSIEETVFADGHPNRSHSFFDDDGSSLNLAVLQFGDGFQKACGSEF